MKVYIASDHAGFRLKQHLKKYLLKKDIKAVDLTKKYKAGDDYPDVAKKVVAKVKKTTDSFGILLCGSGHGVCMVANRYKGIRAAMGYEIQSTKAGRQEDNTNVLCLPGRYLSEVQAEKITSAFLTTKFQERERFIRRIKKF